MNKFQQHCAGFLTVLMTFLSTATVANEAVNQHEIIELRTHVESLHTVHASYQKALKTLDAHAQKADMLHSHQGDYLKKMIQKQGQQQAMLPAYGKAVPTSVKSNVLYQHVSDQIQAAFVKSYHLSAKRKKIFQKLYSIFYRQYLIRMGAALASVQPTVEQSILPPDEAEKLSSLLIETTQAMKETANTHARHYAVSVR